MRFGIIGGGSWATALAKILTDNHHPIHWWIRQENTIRHIRESHHNPHYLNATYFDPSLLTLSTDVAEVMHNADVLVIAVPSAFVADTLEKSTPADWQGKKIVSAIKGILPQSNHPPE